MAIKQYQSSQLARNEDGIVAITVTIIFLIIISLTALGLARLARREQKQALDNQLSTQALYVAEAGINDAMISLQTPSSPYSNVATNKSSCSSNLGIGLSTNLDFLSRSYGGGGGQDNSGVVRSLLGGISAEGEYSCVLITHADDIETPAPTDTSRIFNAKVLDGAGHPATNYNLVIGWQDDGTSSSFSNPNNFFPPATGAGLNWGITTGVLRLDLTSVANMASLDRNSLMNTTLTSFLYPAPDGGAGMPLQSFLATPDQRSQIIKGSCSTVGIPASTGKYCNVTITSIPKADIFLRLKSIYNSTKVKIVAQDDSGNPLKITGAQTIIDSTGKVADIVKRLQVRIGMTSSTTAPEYAIESVDGICKLMQVEPGTTTGYLTEVSGTRDKEVCDPTHN